MASPAQRSVSFGPVSKGGSATRVVPVVNRGRTSATLSLAPSADMLKRCCVEVLPAGEVTLKPRESIDVTFVYKPQVRVRACVFVWGGGACTIGAGRGGEVGRARLSQGGKGWGEGGTRG